jgi:hypothetical protein
LSNNEANHAVIRQRFAIENAISRYWDFVFEGDDGSGALLLSNSFSDAVLSMFK